MQTDNNPKRDTLSISQLNRQAKHLLEGNFPSVWVEGEISNLARPSSGHWYFSLKDNTAQIRCAMFRTHNARLRFNVEAGQQIIARAKLSLYEARGDYQLIIEHIEPAGDGALAKAFEALKNKLLNQGLFEQDNKKPIPSLVQHIAVVTSATGAAIRDILTVLHRRFPAIKITILPTPVQGKEAAAQIARAIDLANKLSKQKIPEYNFDVILVSRGGGSLEDLWPFNEEIVALSINKSRLPVVSAVGHEVDFTISDFVADVRAATPSAAAELLSPDQQKWLEMLEGFEQILTAQIRQHISEQQRRLEWVQTKLKNPASRLQEQHQRLDDLELKLRSSLRHCLRFFQHKVEMQQARLKLQAPNHRISQLKLSVNNYESRLQQQMLHLLQQHKNKLKSLAQLLNTVSPLATLERGYAIVTDKEGLVITDFKATEIGQTINARLAIGNLVCTIEQRITSEKK